MSISSKDAGTIRLAERDYFLDLHSPSWGRALPREAWHRVPARGETRYLWREIRPQQNTESRLPEESLPLFECLLRFPSAPIYGAHRKHEYQHELSRINYHTLRMLRRGDPREGARLDRVFIMHNGLDEIDSMEFYYRLADLMLDETSAMIIRPLPGHLTRFPFPAKYAETPLARYLNDSGDLFRQFLRFMLETHWLLSALTPVSEFKVVAGLQLLAEKERHDGAEVANAIFASWQAAYDAVPNERRPGAHVSLDGVTTDVATLRKLVGWSPAAVGSKAPTLDELRPTLHAVGYSLGGYLAQSAFFTWPFALSSCTTMLAGGALRELALTSFAQPEEWQSVMHSLRYEVESAMVQGRLRVQDGRVAGMDPDAFTAFHRVFYEVFLQDWRGAYHTRLSEFVARLLQIVGGADPIITRQALLDATPKEGVNSLQIANLTHFPLQRNEEWQEFWLPQVAELILRFSARTERTLASALDRHWSAPEIPAEFRKDAHQVAGKSRRNDGLLAARDYARQLEDMVSELDQNGWLFILRNRLPAALLGEDVIKLNQVIHHEDSEILRYVEGLKHRGDVLRSEANHRRLTIVLPAKLRSWFLRESAVLPGKIEVSGGHVPTRPELEAIWQKFEETWRPTGALRRFDPMGAPIDERDFAKALASLTALDPQSGRSIALLNTLPNVWISLSSAALHAIAGGQGSKHRSAVEHQFVAWAMRVDAEDEQAHSEMARWLDSGDLRIVRVSPADVNPRYMGQRILDLRVAAHLLGHSAIAYCYSREWDGIRRRGAGGKVKDGAAPSPSL